MTTITSRPVKITTTDHRDTRATRKRPYTAISESQGTERNGKHRRTESDTRVEHLVSSLEKKIEDLQKRVSLLEKGDSNESVASEPEEPESQLEPSDRIGCPLCHVSFTQSHNLPRHLKRIHKFTSGLSQFCQECDRPFQRLSDFVRHMNVHYAGSGRPTFWEQAFKAASSGSQAESPGQLSSQPCRGLVNATPLHPHPFADTSDAAPSNSRTESTQQMISQEPWDIFSAAPSDPPGPAQQFSQESYDLFSAAPFDSPTLQLFSQEDYDLFSAAPSDPLVEPIQQPFSQEDRGMVSAVPSDPALGVDDVETLIENLTRGLLRNAATDPSIIPRLLILSGGVKAGG